MSSQKRARSIDNNMISLRDTKRAARGEKKKVVFAQTEPTVHYFDPLNGRQLGHPERVEKHAHLGFGWVGLEIQRLETFSEDIEGNQVVHVMFDSRLCLPLLVSRLL